MFQAGESNGLQTPDAESGLLVAEDRPSTERDEALSEDESAETFDKDRPAFGGALELEAGRRRRGQEDDEDSCFGFDDDEDEDPGDDDDLCEDDFDEDDEDADDDLDDLAEDDED